MNPLARYFSETHDTPTKLAVRIGRQPSTITRIMSNQRNASPRLAWEIEKATEGKVLAAEILAVAVRNASAGQAA